MNKFYKLILLAIFSIGLSAFFAACSDDDEADEWTATYVYLQNNNYLRGEQVFSLIHSSAGITGEDITLTFTAKIQKPATQDILVRLHIDSKELPADKFVLSSKEVTIKAGQTVSEEVTLSVPDLSFLQDIQEKSSFPIEISIESIQTKQGNTFVSDLQAKIRTTIRKAAFTNLSKGTPANSQLIKDRSNWKITVQEGVEGSGNNVIDGSGGSDLAKNNMGFWFSVDLGETLTLTGIKTNHWASAYAPSEIEVYQSADGTNWKSLSTLAVSGNVQYITFLSPITTRYLKYEIIGISRNGRTDITEFNLYQPIE